jgi:hypothetical protein
VDFEKTHNTVKPVYNGHPWDSKKVAVVLKVVVGLRLVDNSVVVLVGWGFRLAVVRRWSLTQV